MLHVPNVVYFTQIFISTTFRGYFNVEHHSDISLNWVIFLMFSKSIAESMFYVSRVTTVWLYLMAHLVLLVVSLAITSTTKKVKTQKFPHLYDKKIICYNNMSGYICVYFGKRKSLTLQNTNFIAV